MRLHFLTNGVFSTGIAGGDIHFLKLAEGAAKYGYELNFFGGHALQQVIRKHNVPGTVTLTDSGIMPKANTGALGGQVKLFRDFYGRYRRTMAALDMIGEDDIVYAVSDYWFDVLPAVRSAARRKMMVLHMEAPRLGEIIMRSRPDVDAVRASSLHYWASQEYSLRRFCRCSPKHIFHLHPAMQPRLRKLGVREDEMTSVSYGLEVALNDSVPAPARDFDVVWIGRVHRQKGIDDLLATLQFLAARVENFRAVFIGNVKEGLAPELEKRALSKHVTFSGFVSEAEKIGLFKSSRLFLMPSRHEGSPRVIGESIIASTPVVAYDIPNYRPVFGEYVRYVPPFDLAAFQSAAEDEIKKMRAGENYLERLDLAEFKRANSWETTQAKFLTALERLRAQR
ncbi:MAG TPA: glycosyltransferase [Candidatus Limnocylindria bacterium]|nr:glycosyltransferase [Candidatus Limnocylindria bacterium]